jgi:hypothetical protein
LNLLVKRIDVQRTESKRLYVRHWLGVIYFFEFLLIFGGIISINPQIKNFGWQALGLTITFHAAISLLGYYMTDQRRKLKLARAILAAVLVMLIAFGGIHAVEKATNLSWWEELVLAAMVALPL